MSETPETTQLLTPSEVAVIFRVSPNTVTRWANAGKLAVIFTPGGTRRYSEAQVLALRAGVPGPEHHNWRDRDLAPGERDLRGLDEQR
jgi:excisionase family DNA binding protein